VIAPAPRSAIQRVILDTNVLLSGIFFGGVPGRILAAWRDDRLELVLSLAILAEYHEAGAALAVRYAGIDAPLQAILVLLAQTATIVDAPELPTGVSADRDDDKFLACAVGAQVSLIVSGDKHLLRVSGWAGVTIITPRQFADRYLGDPQQRDDV
jgi:putative PIN family toxin of toxin-antitoxin system